jgi:hypothetical protein
MMDPIQRETPIIEVWFPIEKDAEGYPTSRDFEGLRCEPLNSNSVSCTIVSVPFYLRNVAYGDTITTRQNPSGYVEFDKVIARSGHSVYRILLYDPSIKDEWIRRFLDFGVLLEHDGNLIAIAVPPASDADALVSVILDGKNKGLWGAQDGYISDE